MTERERLIELIIQSVNGCARNWAETIADYLLTNGVVVLPCKVGDVVYFANTLLGEALEATVTKIEFNHYTNPQEWLTIEYNISPYTGEQEYKSRIDLMFGKTVFLTKEEAEKALERSKNNE